MSCRLNQLPSCKKLLICLLFPVAAVVLLIGGCHFLVVQYARGRIYQNVDEIPAATYGLLLGTTPQTRIGARKNLFFQYRIDAAVQLYKSGKVKYIVVSGDDHSLGGVDETKCMKDSLVAQGVPADHIFLDGKGYRTLDSVVRLCKIYGVKEFTIISQRFHNERALYQAGHLDLDIDRVQAFNATDATSHLAVLTYIREYLARVKLFIDLFTGKQPAVMGTPHPLSPDIP